MHKHSDLEINNLTRIVGHTSLNVTIRNGQAVQAKLEVEESKRFYRHAVIEKSFRTIPQMVSRICGTCGISHALCAVEAIEKAFDIQPTEQSLNLRRLASNSNVLRDHAMHLYFLCVPDIFGKESILAMEETHHNLIHDALDVKRAGNMLGTTIAGRSIHSPTIQVGGFTTCPDSKKVKECIAYLKKVRPKALELIDLFAKYECSFPTKTNFVALKTKNFDFLEGYLASTTGLSVDEPQFSEHLTQVVLPYSTANSFEFDGEPYMVGALARINLNKRELHKNTKRDARKYLKEFPASCVFKNNLAQAIETLHCFDASLDLLKTLECKKERIPEIPQREACGVGVVEAPRGTLYHSYEIDANGIIRDAEFVIPTAQNIIQIEKDIVTLVNSLIETKTKEEIRMEIEKLIRAYDPCMNCATHFLKVNWLSEE
jgi:coenzyme F420-reducing hydrogenase alpha subunit